MHGFEPYLLLLVGPFLGLATWALGRILPGWRMELVLFITGSLVLASLIADQSDRPGDPFTPPLLVAEGQRATHPDIADAPTRDRCMEDGPDSRRCFDQWTAVYDISAHTVYLPNGTKLEAHSGLGLRLDDPRYVHERMRGATPPSVYELALREKPFHGIRALRLTPVDSSKVFGRTGLLAHTYMLGPKGDSNGCVVFKDYHVFLQAYESGELKRLAVVARIDDASLQRFFGDVSSSGAESRQAGASVASYTSVSH